MSKTIFYDCPSKEPRVCWSLNLWKSSHLLKRNSKARLVLNYKGIDYETNWVEYNEVVSTMKSLLRGWGEVIDSRVNAVEIEKKYPTPSLYMDEPIVVQMRDRMLEILGPLAPIVMPKVPRILAPVAAEFFEREREKVHGMPLAQFGKEKGTDEAWAAVQPIIQQIAGDLKKNEKGPFFLSKACECALIV
ncbi:hypothetical protein LTR70_008920 [Exophiala xenobiotica]|uniref:Glutathione S-transferase UstS-like C-terminal domain-containing protein n=1 Tax=Lithohypha guttulata TaxID=1690604 RepID=A0ABR0K040_9EURO|nr:hypothetical protein LTR24_008629 [Lithohypha guttulata]KAK5311243.1 hypothetical protein LTR70_008920 [Exophiala xenobiotica]